MFFPKFLSIMLFGQIYSHNLDFFKLTEIWGVHYCYMLITVLIFIFSKFFLFIFFGQIWSQNLKFFKLTEIWYRVRLLYAYFDFDGVFSKLVVSHFFLGKFDLKIWSSPNWLKFHKGVHYYYNFNVYFFKNFLIHIILVKMLSQSTGIWHLCTLLILLADYNRKVSFFKKFLFKILWANFVPSCFLHIDEITSYL